MSAAPGARVTAAAGLRSTGAVGRRRRALLEVLGLLLWAAVFLRLHDAVGGDVAAAGARAHALQSAERALHLDVERAANAWLVAHPLLAELSALFYRSYYAVVLGVLAWTFLRHPDDYLRARRVLVAMTVLVLPVFWAWPVSPPRFALPGVVDVVAAHDVVASDWADPDSSRNLHSAMPSLHVGWSLWCAWAASTALRGSHPRLVLLPWAFPLVMAAVVLATGNHYVLDLVGSAALVVVAVVTASWWGRSVERRRAASAGGAGRRPSAEGAPPPT